MEIYNCTSINIDIICKSYDRNPFVQKNENNGRTVYNFKFRGEEVCITIPLQPGTLCVEGNGRKIWCKEATCIYKYKVKTRNNLYQKKNLAIALQFLMLMEHIIGNGLTRPFYCINTAQMQLLSISTFLRTLGKE